MGTCFSANKGWKKHHIENGELRRTFPLNQHGKIPNKFLKFFVPFLSQLLINDYVFLRDASIDKTHEALVTLSLFTSLVVMHEITPYFGLENKRKKAKRSMAGEDTKNSDDTHICYHMLFASLTYYVWIYVIIDTLKTEYAPLHCKH